MGQIKESNIENLVFQGVGTRGVALVGALQALSDNGNFTNIKRVSGVFIWLYNSIFIRFRVYL